MPTYEIECLDCKTRFDRYSSFEQRLADPCPKCGSIKLQPIISNPAVVLEHANKIPQWSIALGRPVKDKQDYIDGLKKINANIPAIMDGGAY